MESIREYCLNCTNKPCKNNGCPLNNDIPEFIHEKGLKKAFEILSKTTVMPAICGRVCPHLKQCEGSCIRGVKGEPVDIGKMEALIGDESIKNNYKIPVNMDSNLKNKKVAVVGSGPAGLTCSAFLAKKGINVTIYEKHKELGGVLTHGIPEFRLDPKIVQNTIEKILEIGNIKVELNKELGKDILLKDLSKEYDAVFLGIGANISSQMGINGEALNGVYGANEVLEYKENIDIKDKKVAVIGGGNVAIDIARTAKRSGAKKVTIIYRRDEGQMPAEKYEIEDAKKEKVNFLFKTNLVQIIGNSKVEKLELIKTNLVNTSEQARPVPVNIENSNFMIDADIVFMALGSEVDKNIVKNLNLELDEKGKIKIDESGKTSIKNVYAGGDVAGKIQTVAWAARSGRDAAEAIIKKL